MAARPFDLGGLFAAVDTERRHRELSWAALAQAVGVSTSTIRRFEQAEDAEADGVLALISWLGVAPEEFMAGGVRGAGVRLRCGEEGYVRVDMEQVARLSDRPSRSATRTRTTIQNLADVAQRAGRPVASLTRLSKT